MKKRIRLQAVLTYSMIALAAVLAIFALGFMTGFYTLFMDGNNDMFTFFKDLQILNNVLFKSSLIFLVLSLLLIPFDINKQAAGILGVAFTLIVALVNIMNGITLFITNNYFISAYRSIDFSSFEGTVPGMLPFTLAGFLMGAAIILSVSLFVLTGLNYLKAKKERVSHE